MCSKTGIETWKRHINAGNDSFDKYQILASLAHYQAAIKQATALLDQWHDKKAAVAALVVSYHNLADLYLREGEPLLAEYELENAHDKLNLAMQRTQTDSPDIEALLWGLNRTYFALVRHRSAHARKVDTAASLIPNLFETTFKQTLN